MDTGRKEDIKVKKIRKKGKVRHIS